MGLVLTGVVAGVLGTLMMDLLNPLFARSGVILRIEVAGIGRMAAGWMRGRFRYGHPSEMESIKKEVLYGYLAHYAVGVGLAVPFVLAWDFLVGGLPSAAWAVVYGVATAVASFFFVYPSMGLGVCGSRSPEKAKAFITPLANHLFYGLGLGVGVVLG